MAKSNEKLRAIKLRRSGFSISEIATNVGVSKSTVSLWCRELVLSSSELLILKQRHYRLGMEARLRSGGWHRKERLRRISAAEAWAEKRLSHMNAREALLVGAALFWAEGSKNERSRFIFTNSDPRMIRFILAYLRILGTDRNRVGARIFINDAHRHRVDAVGRYWIQETGIRSNNFLKPIFIKTPLQKKYENFSKHYGTLRIRVLRSSDIFYKTTALVGRLGTVRLTRLS